MTKMKTKHEAEAGAEAIVPDYAVIVGLKKSRFPDIVERAIELSAEIKEREEELKGLKEMGCELLVRSKVKSVRYGERLVTRMDGVHVSLSRTRLLELGVSEKVVEKATTRTAYMTLLVGKEKAAAGGREDA